MLDLAIAKVIKAHTDIICNRVTAKWGNMAAIEGNAEIHCNFPKIVANAITATIEASGQKAWIAEFGRGSLMEDKGRNPYLQEYLSSTNVNQWRFHSSRMPIMGRSAGQYKDLDGNTRTSTGKMQGLDLERDGDPRFKPMLPSHIIEHEVTAEFPEIIAHIQRVVEAEVLAELTMDVQIYI
jgi:hypothetical protein